MHAMSLDDAYQVNQVLARGSGGVTELVSIGGTGPFVRKKIPLQLARRNVWSALSKCASPRLPHVEATYELPDCFVVIYDYIAGEPLESMVSEHGRMPMDAALAVMGQLCEAVGELHAHGIVHRDISPKNVIMASDGAHLIDLGISRMHAEKPMGHDTTILGTWGFAPAEQYGFAQTDSRSDIYSLGRLLGYLLTGVYPTDGDYERLLNDDDVVDAHTRAVIARACALEPSARPQTVTRFMDELMGRAPLPDALAADSHGGEDGVRRARRGAGRIGRTLRRLRDSRGVAMRGACRCAGFRRSAGDGRSIRRQRASRPHRGGIRIIHLLEAVGGLVSAARKRTRQKRTGRKRNIGWRKRCRLVRLRQDTADRRIRMVRAGRLCALCCRTARHQRGQGSLRTDDIHRRQRQGRQDPVHR